MKFEDRVCDSLDFSKVYRMAANFDPYDKSRYGIFHSCFTWNDCIWFRIKNEDCFFSDITSYTVVYSYKWFWGICCLRLQSRKYYISWALPWEPQISHSWSSVWRLLYTMFDNCTLKTEVTHSTENWQPHTRLVSTEPCDWNSRNY